MTTKVTIEVPDQDTFEVEVVEIVKGYTTPTRLKSGQSLVCYIDEDKTVMITEVRI